VSPEQITAVMAGLSGLIVAVTALVLQLRGLRKDLNGRLSQLVDASSLSAHREGELAGRDFISRRKRTRVPVVAPIDPELE
jgi:hypothetical protein